MQRSNVLRSTGCSSAQKQKVCDSVLSLCFPQGLVCLSRIQLGTCLCEAMSIVLCFTHTCIRILYLSMYSVSRCLNYTVFFVCTLYILFPVVYVHYTSLNYITHITGNNSKVCQFLGFLFVMNWPPSQALDALRSELPRQEWAADDVYGHWPLQFDHKESTEYTYTLTLTTIVLSNIINILIGTL